MADVALLLLLLLRVAQDAAPAPLARELTGSPVVYEISKGDSLRDLAGRFGIDAATIARRNGLRAGAALKPGTLLTLDAVHIVPVADEPLVLNVPQRLLFVFCGGYTEAFPVAVGRAGWPTPRGAFTVDVKEEHPTWDVPASIQEEMRRQGKQPVQQVPPSPDNPLGEYWIGLSLPRIGIHGTNAPRSIYTFATHGCIRVHPDRVGGLFGLVEEGMPGAIIYEPVLIADVGGRIYVEVHPDVYRRAAAPLTALHAAADAHGLGDRIDWRAVESAVALREGIAVDVSVDPREP